MRCYLFDIDGTLADVGHRLHYIRKEPPDWDSFFDACVDDKPIFHVLALASSLFTDQSIVLVSGRPERSRLKTIRWLNIYLPYRWVESSPIYMRKDDDHRPDDIVKSELLDQILADGYEPIMAFDDRTSVVKMWRARGIPCAQVAEGDY